MSLTVATTGAGKPCAYRNLPHLTLNAGFDDEGSSILVHFRNLQSFPRAHEFLI